MSTSATMTAREVCLEFLGIKVFDPVVASVFFDRFFAFQFQSHGAVPVPNQVPIRLNDLLQWDSHAGQSVVAGPSPDQYVRPKQFQSELPGKIRASYSRSTSRSPPSSRRSPGQEKLKQRKSEWSGIIRANSELSGKICSTDLESSASSWHQTGLESGKICSTAEI